MGLEPRIVAAGYHRYDGLRALAHGITLELQWPEHPVYPSHGYVVRRRDLDAARRRRTPWRRAPILHQGTEAIAPIVEGGLVRGAVVKDKATRRRDGGPGPLRRRRRRRQLPLRPGARHRPQPVVPAGHGHPGLLREPAARRPVDRVAPSTSATATATSLPGYGWIFPVGDGTINVGIGLLSTFRDWKTVNTSHLMDEFAATAPAYWGIDRRPRRRAPPTGGRLPMGGSVAPNVGPTWVLVGDAAGIDQPVQRRGHRLRLRDRPPGGAAAVDEALTTGDGLALQRYPRAARRRVRPLLQGRPPVRQGDRQPGADARADPGRHAVAARSWSGCCGSWPTCCATDELGPAEAAYKAAAQLAVPRRASLDPASCPTSRDGAARCSLGRQLGDRHPADPGIDGP